jgi:hypothetical protein
LAGKSRWLTEGLIFVAALFVYAYFHQGGGWSQNVRFAQVRAIVEEGRLPIDSFLVYQLTPSSARSGHFARVSVSDGACEFEGRKVALAWRDNQGSLLPVDDRASSNDLLLPVDQVAVSGDLAYCRGHFHPNKAPGPAMLAVPAYAVLYQFERLAGFDPDDWWVLTVNAWLAGALSVGLVSAVGCVLFYRLAADLSGADGRGALLATAAFGAGTLILPYATMLHEHNFVAVALLAGFYFLYRAKVALVSGPHFGRWLVRQLWLAGACAGVAATCNYVSAAVVVFFAVYLGRLRLTVRSQLALGSGVLVPFVALCAYHVACFGTPFTTNYHFQNPHFRADAGTLFGVFQPPRVDVLAFLLVSPYRGLFFSSPILALGVVGWVRMRRDSEHRAEATLFLCAIAFFLLFNCSFNGWPGGWAVGPRYLVPAIPFLALPLVFAIRAYPRTATALTIVSAAIMLLATAVDPQCPLGEPGFASVAGRPFWRYSPLAEYELPLFMSGQPTSFLQAQADATFEHLRDVQSETGSLPPPWRDQTLAQVRSRLNEAVALGHADILPLAALRGPLSVNPQGVYEGRPFQFFSPADPRVRWNAFNFGELLFPGSRLSLLPLLGGIGALVCVALAMTGRSGQIAESARAGMPKRAESDERTGVRAGAAGPQ